MWLSFCEIYYIKKALVWKKQNGLYIENSYFFAVAFLALISLRLALLSFLLLPSFWLRSILDWNFSTLRAVSTNFCSPVKNGWQREQSSVLISSIVEPTSNSLPQAQVTFALLLYFGWILFFICVER